MALDLELSDAWLWRAVGGSFFGWISIFHWPIHIMSRLLPTIPRLLTAPQTKTKQKKPSPGLSNRPYGLGPTAHPPYYIQRQKGYR
jgi:hypothetical protein